MKNFPPLKRRISVVTSLFRSAPYIREFHRRHLACLERLGMDHEFVFVDDGSPDESGALVAELIESGPGIRLVSLSRNFGQSAAMFAGMKAATGDFVYTTDSDLEEAPENLESMYRRISQEEGVDVVYGVAPHREGGIVRAVLGRVFFRILDLFSTVKIPHDQTWQRIMSRRYVDSLLLHEEAETLPAGLMVLTGYRQIPMVIEKKFKGSTTYSLRRRFVLALDGLLSFSPRPALAICIAGLAISGLSFLAIFFLVIERIFFVRFQSGWLSVIASIWCVCGILMTSIGVIGIYIVKIFNQVKQRPRYIVKSVRESSDLAGNRETARP